MLNAYCMPEPPGVEGIRGGGKAGLPVVPKGNGGGGEADPGGGGWRPGIPGVCGVGCPGVVGCAEVVGCPDGSCGEEGFGY